MFSSRAKLHTLATAVLLSAVAIPLGAQQLTQEPTLHEYFDASSMKLGKLGGTGAGGEKGDRPERIPSREPSGAPPLTLDVDKEEPVIDAEGMKSALPMPAPQGGLNPENALNTLDNETNQVDELNYFSSFDPSVIPYKRVVAQNRVIDRGEYAFVVDAGRLRRVPLEPRPKGAREDMFWGTFLLRTKAGDMMPIPSVAPNQRVMEIKTEPQGSLEVFKEKAGNFYVRSNHDGLLRVNMKIAVPLSYFEGEFKPTSWQAFDATQVASLPASARQKAKELARELGWSKRSEPQRVLLDMVSYFRDFEGKEFPKELQGQDVYSAIVRQKIGVCRHRSFAFVISVTALGIPARYVYNEAHAFVEVLWPGVGWRRIDLGGAANDLLMRTGAQQQRVHDASSRDSLPKPPAYLKELERLAAQNKPSEGGAQDGAAQAGNEGTNGGDNTTPGEQSSVEEGSSDNPGGADSNPSASADNTPGIEPPPPEDTRRQTTARVIRVPKALMRGQDFEVTGQLVAGGERLSGRKVRVILVAPQAGNASGSAIILGEATTDAQGGFRATLKMPPKLAIGRWSLRVVYDGDKTYRPTESE